MRPIARLGDDRPIAHRDREHPVHGLDDPVAPHLDDDRIHRAEPMRAAIAFGRLTRS